MAKEVFNRYELKFRVNDKQYRELRERLEQYMEADAYSKDGGFYTICNIYYDTPDNDLIRRSIDGPVYKEKMRLRSYGTVTKDTKVFLEIKKKYEGLVNKRRTKMVLQDAYDYFETGKKPEVQPFMNGQVLEEIDYMKNRLGLVPKLFLSYDRCALFAKDDKEFRVTFDRNITARRYDLGLHYGVYGEKLISDDEWIMEVKIDRAMPLWMTKILSEMKIYKDKFSKYGREYELYIEAKSAAGLIGKSAANTNEKETGKCLNHYSELQMIVQ